MVRHLYEAACCPISATHGPIGLLLSTLDYSEVTIRDEAEHKQSKRNLSNLNVPCNQGVLNFSLLPQSASLKPGIDQRQKMTELGFEAVN